MKLSHVCWHEVGVSVLKTFFQHQLAMSNPIEVFATVSTVKIGAR